MTLTILELSLLCLHEFLAAGLLELHKEASPLWPHFSSVRFSSPFFESPSTKGRQYKGRKSEGGNTRYHWDDPFIFAISTLKG
jgi:hypothetical protein